jgi:hypothetical protein
MEINKIESLITVKSDDKIGDVRQKVADELAVGVHGLNLVYMIEVDKTQKKYRRLATQDDWNGVVSFGRMYRTSQKNKPGIDQWGVSIKEAPGDATAAPTTQRGKAKSKVCR